MLLFLIEGGNTRGSWEVRRKFRSSSQIFGNITHNFWFKFRFVRIVKRTKRCFKNSAAENFSLELPSLKHGFFLSTVDRVAKRLIWMALNHFHYPFVECTQLCSVGDLYEVKRGTESDYTNLCVYIISLFIRLVIWIHCLIISISVQELNNCHVSFTRILFASQFDSVFVGCANALQKSRCTTIFSYLQILLHHWCNAHAP